MHDSPNPAFDIEIQILALRKAKLTKLYDEEIYDVKFGGTILKKSYPTPFNMETGYRVRPSKYNPPDADAGGVGQGDDPMNRYSDFLDKN